MRLSTRFAAAFAAMAVMPAATQSTSDSAGDSAIAQMMEALPTCAVGAKYGLDATMAGY